MIAEYCIDHRFASLFCPSRKTTVRPHNLKHRFRTTTSPGCNRVTARTGETAEMVHNTMLQELCVVVRSFSEPVQLCGGGVSFPRGRRSFSLFAPILLKRTR